VSREPSVTVVIPTYNRTAELRRAIRTVQLQTLTDWELVIVDDGSPEPVVLTGDRAADERIVLVRHPEGRGVSHARNTGIERARAPWIAFLDDDDLWWPGKLAAQLRQAAAHGSTFVFTGRYTIDPAGHVISIRGPAPTENLTRTLLFKNLVGEPSSVIARRDALLAVGGFDTSLSVIADWEMWVKLSRVAVPLGMPDLTAAIVYHDDSMQLTRSLQIPAEVERMRERHADLLAAEQIALGSSLTELWMANKRWRGERSRASLMAYIRVARRHGQVSAIARRLIARKVREITAGRAELAPAWVLEQLGSAQACAALYRPGSS
jgi:glycosyltransferase involved in cell wall biosynthesis